MKKNTRHPQVALKLPDPVPALILYCRHVILVMTNNPAFPDPNPTLADIAKHLDDLMDDPEVCQAVNDYNVQYLLIGGAMFRTADTKWKYYAGLADPFASPGFELVDSSGPSKLYKITGCGPAQPAG